MTLINPLFDRTAFLPIQDRVTGLRRGALRYTDGQPPPVDGCRWCALPGAGHGQGRWVDSRGWHQWAPPTEAQRVARKAARTAASTPAPLKVVTAPAGVGGRRPVCDAMNHDSRGHETFCQEDPDDGHPVHDDGNGTTWDRED